MIRSISSPPCDFAKVFVEAIPMITGGGDDSRMRELNRSTRVSRLLPPLREIPRRPTKNASDPVDSLMVDQLWWSIH